MTTWAGRAALAAFGFALSAVFLIDLCSAIFQCGCQPLWAAANAHCNIHVAGMRHCPWCVDGKTGHYVALWTVLLVQGAIAFWPAALSFATRTLAVIMAFPVVGGAVAIAFGIAKGYWK